MSERRIERLRFDQRGRSIEPDGSIRWETDEEFAAHLQAKVVPDPTIYREPLERMRLRRAIEACAMAIRRRYECGEGPLVCGAFCQRPLGHEPPCFCEGVDEFGEETCPA